MECGFGLQCHSQLRHIWNCLPWQKTGARRCDTSVHCNLHQFVRQDSASDARQRDEMRHLQMRIPCYFRTETTIRFISMLGSRPFQLKVLIAVLSLVVLAVVCDKAVMPLIVNSGKTVTVPNIIGMQKQQAIDLLESQGLQVEKVAEQFNTNVQHGVVITQLPFPNSLVKEGRRVYLSVSKGYEVITMPDLSMMSQREAQLALMGMGLQVGTVSYDFRDSIPENRVIRQSYMAGMSVGSGTSVNLVLSKDSNATVIAPSLERLSQSDAMQTLQDMNLQTGEVFSQSDETYAVGTVIKQSPAAGTRLHLGSKIDLWVSSAD